MEFDAFDLCTNELQQKLTPMREKFKALEDSQVEDSLDNLKDKKAKGKAAKENEKKRNVKQEAFWFEDGNFCSILLHEKLSFPFSTPFSFLCRFGL